MCSYRSKMFKVLILFVELIVALSSPIMPSVIDNQTLIFSTTELALDDDSAETIYKDTDYMYEEEYSNISYHENIQYQNLIIKNKTAHEVSNKLNNIKNVIFAIILGNTSRICNCT